MDAALTISDTLSSQLTSFLKKEAVLEAMPSFDMRGLEKLYSSYNDAKTSPETDLDYAMTTLLTQNIDRFQNWSDEDIPIGPSDEVIRNIKNLVPDFISHELIPTRITPSIEEGLCFVFKKNNILIYIEFYNDGDIGLISEDIIRKEIIENFDVEAEKIIPNLIRLLS